MSVINKMLQDLDARNAAATDEPLAAKQVRTVRAAADRREWFWRILAVLLLAAAGLVGWVAWQMQPRKLATDLAFSAAEEARRKQTAARAPKPASVPAKPIVVAEAPKPPPPAIAEVHKPAPAPARTELFKLAQSIDTPITERAAPAAKAQAKQAEAARPPAVEKAAHASAAKVPPSAPLAAAPSEPTSRLSKRERPRSGPEEAEALFRHGVMLLRQRRSSEALEQFSAALVKFPGHEAARQAQVSILLERRQMEEARRILEEGLAHNPAQAQFATVLARIHVESGDYRGAAAILAPAANAGRDDAEFQVLHGAVLQRLSRHAEAVEALQSATRLAAQPGATWVALGVSFEALGRKPDAVQAYRRSLGAPLAQDVRGYAEGRIRALDY